MAIRTDTYALDRSVAYLLERAAEQTITAPIRYGSAGALVTPNAGGTVSIIRPDGTAMVDEQTITVASSTATYTVTPAATEPLGEGWEVRWTLAFSGVTYPIFRLASYLAEYVPPNLISVASLYTRRPELKHRIPQSQGPRGDDVGWQPQIDEAYHEFLQRLLDDARPVWLLREATGYRRWLLIRALQLCVQAIPAGPDSDWAQASKELHFELRDALGEMRLQYSDDSPALRRGRQPTARLAPVGRPSW